MNKFWMCYVNGRNGPTVKHFSRASALEEARRLAEHTKAYTFVLEATYSVDPPKIIPGDVHMLMEERIDSWGRY